MTAVNEMIGFGVALAALSGLCNGLFTAPMKLEHRWKWENIWLAFIVVACLIMPAALVASSVHDLPAVLSKSPPVAVRAALLFGFLWGFGAICFGKSVDRLGVAIANTLVIGLSSALGSLVPLMMSSAAVADERKTRLYGGIAAFLLGVFFCGVGRPDTRPPENTPGRNRNRLR